LKIEEQLKAGKFTTEEQKAQVNVLFTANIIKTNLNNKLKAYDLTHEQFNVLRIIKGQFPEPICVKEITDRMIEANSNTTRILDKLQEKGLVNRTLSERDRRELWIVLTEKGNELLTNISQNFEIDNPFSGRLSMAEASLLNTLLNKLRPV
jgi:DNA-binding MarR family transcriptional regulator